MIVIQSSLQGSKGVFPGKCGTRQCSSRVLKLLKGDDRQQRTNSASDSVLICNSCDVIWSKVPRDKDYMDIDATVRLYKGRRCPDCGKALEEITFVSGLSDG